MPPGSVRGEIAGGVTRLMVYVANFVESVTEVALTVTALAEATTAGAWYVTVVAVLPDKLPAPLEIVQFTPALFGSLVTVAEMDFDPAWSRFVGLGVVGMETTIAGLIVMLRAELETE